MVEPLSSFAIRIAAGIVLEIYPTIKKFRTQGVDKQINVAFDKALQDWSVNEEVRVQKERELRSLLHSHIEQRDIVTKKSVKPDTLDFLTHFEKRLAEQTQAYDYLKSIIDQQRHDETIASFSRIEEQLSEIQEEIKRGNIEPREVGDWLDKIAFEKGKGKAIETILNWYEQGEINIDLKEFLLLSIKKVYDQIGLLSYELRNLKSQKDYSSKELSDENKIELKDSNRLNTYMYYNLRHFLNLENFVNETSNIDSTEERINILRKIKNGHKNSSNYHEFIMDTLSFIFGRRLSNPKKEVNVNEGRMRVDIIFDNVGNYGFFEHLDRLKKILCPKIFIECKNYNSDVKNPELAQLASRLNTKTGRFGILTCRHIKNKKLIISKCRDYFHRENKIIIVLEDEDIIRLLNIKETANESEIDDFMSNKYDEFTM